MALNKEDLSFKKLISKEFTNPSRQFFQEVTTATLDISSTDVYSTIISSSSGSAITDGYAVQYTQFVLTPDPTYPTTAWYFCSGAGFTPGVSSYDATKVQRNFISDKYGSQYEVKLFDNLGTQIFKTDPINWYFDYKTGILNVADPGSPSTYTTPYKVSVLQYIGDTLNTTLTELSASIGGGAGFPFSGNAVITGSLLISSSGLTITGSGINILSGSINIINGGITSSLFGTASWANNVVSASHTLTASFVNPLNQNVTITGSLLVSNSGISITGSGLSILSGSITVTNGGITGSLFGTASWANNVVSASHALTASFINPLNQNVTITGSLLISSSGLSITGSGISILSGSITVTNGGITGSLFGTASFAVSSSHALTASFINPLNQNVTITGSTYITGGFEAIGTGGSRAYLGTHIVGTATGDVTGSGLIISSSNLPSNHHNFVKIGNTELVDQNIIGIQNRFIINNVDEIYIRSGGLSDGGGLLNTGLLLEHKTGTFKVYSSNNSTPLTVSSASTTITSPITAIQAAETVALNYLLAFDSDPTSQARNIGWVLPSKFITSTGSSAGQIISGSGNLPALAITGGLSVNGGITGSLLGTASWANNVVSASHALTASSVNILNQNVTINGNLTAGTSSLANLTVTNNAIINGDFFVYGSSSVINVNNLSIEDKFILLNSGSIGPINNEGGIIVQTSASDGTAYGTALFYDQEANRWLIAKSSSVAFNTTSITVGSTTDFIVTVSASLGSPVGTPPNFGTGNSDYSVGQMYIQTDSNDIYIYA